MFNFSRSALLIAVVFGCPVIAMAQDSLTFSGAIYGIAQAEDTGYVGADGDLEVLPFGEIAVGRFALDLEGEFSFGFVASDTFEARLLATYRAAPDFPNTVLFDGLDREDGIDLGLAATWSLGALTLEAEVNADANSEAGVEAVLEAKQALPVGRAILAPYAGLTWRDADRGNYLFGVSASEATPRRVAHDTGSTFSPHLGLEAAYPISDRLNLIGVVEHQFLADGLTNSPLADGDGRSRVTLGLQYQF